MNLTYKGINKSGLSEWIESDLEEVIEEWQMIRYRSFVESLQENIGRQLTKDELRTILWLSGFEQNSINNIVSIVSAAHLHGKNTK
ncbi:hypothetical protein P4U05_27900 [Bacillus paranthracis]|uniref:hypothetical protein n=1 Tax=Bacillus paranthracis TaxID=2026186 RepID=UPI000200F069|nr:hypothetical protein [Bacillus paranthracis]ADY24801.1 hypothetical protein YBT020_28224 [Bacillus thuringiensis serovar finitimus YBT-020]MRC74422.1 hypothetical protein [Bacillus thuringiensis]OTX67223.1 hypothetical protein BK722_20670 [Bacillus thuringiensis serovar finitimus]MCR6801083.1 hypothetical protein [Bacillus paranthracis]MEC3360500.1 hypothetical protein [Bacillus paranthracis]